MKDLRMVCVRIPKEYASKLLYLKCQPGGIQGFFTKCLEDLPLPEDAQAALDRVCKKG